MRLVRFLFGVANAALDDRLVNSVVFSGLLRQQAEIDEESFNGSEHRLGGWKGLLRLGRRLLVLEQNLLFEDNCELHAELVLITGREHGRAETFHRRKRAGG